MSPKDSEPAPPCDSSALQEEVSRNAQDSLEKFEEAQRIAHIGYWDRDLANDRVTLADEACRILGIPLTETCQTLKQWNQRWEALIYPEDQPQVLRAMDEALAGSSPYKLDYRIVLSGGEIRCVHSEGNVTWDESGHPIRIRGMVQDVTERKRAEEEIRRLNSELEERVRKRTEELAKSEHRFRTIYDMAPVSIWRTDWTHVIAMIEQLRAEGITDFKAWFEDHPDWALRACHAVVIEDINQCTVEMFKARDKADLVASIGTMIATPDFVPVLAGILAALAEGKPLHHTGITLNTLKGGQIHGLLAMSFPNRGSNSGNVLATLIDITEREQAMQDVRASNERMRLFFERQLVGMAISSPEKGWIEVNDKMCEMLGYSREELSKLTWTELTYPEDLPSDLTQFERLLKGEIESYTLEKRFVRKDGHLVFTNLSVGCVRRPDHSVDYVLALFEDITQRKQAERKAEEALKKEVVLRREIHHRVKNNLQVITSLLYLQSTKVSDPAALALFKESQMRIRSIALVHQMLYHREDLSKISFFDYVRQLAADLFTAYRVTQDTVGLKIGSDGVLIGIETAIPCGIIVTELLTNSLKYAFPDGAKGEIEISLLPEGRSSNLILSVRDDGIGIPRDLYSNGAQTMGLNLVQDLTRQLSGRMELEQPVQGRGTSIRIIFPETPATN